MRQFSNHFWYTLSWRNFTTLCEKWLFEKVQLYNCLFWLTSFCQLIQRNCILHALTWENTSDLILLYLLWHRELSLFTTSSFWPDIYLEAVPVWCTSVFLGGAAWIHLPHMFKWSFNSLACMFHVYRFVFVLLCNTCLNLREGLNRCSRNTWLMFVLLIPEFLIISSHRYPPTLQ